MEIQLPHNKYSSLCIRQYVAAKKVGKQNKIPDYRHMFIKLTISGVSFTYLASIHAIHSLFFPSKPAHTDSKIISIL